MRFLLFFGLLVFAGCKVTAPQAPALDLPEIWTEGVVSTSNGVEGENLNAKVPPWWTRCQDPLLEALIQEAMASGPDLHIAAARVKEADLRWQATSAGFGPSLDFSRSLRREDQSSQSFNFGDDAIPGFPTDQIFKVRTVSRHEIRGRWEADLIGRNDLRTMSALANIDLAQAAYEDAILLLSTRICDTLADLRESMQQLAITESTIRRNERSLKLVETRFDVGLGNELELAQARRTLAEARAQLPQAEIGPRAACDALAALLGKHPGSMLHLLDPEMVVPPTPEGELTIQPKDLLTQRPDLRQLAAEIQQAAANAGLAEAATQPTFGLEAALGTESNGAEISLSRTAALWNVILTGATPLFDGGRRKLESKAAGAVFEAAVEQHRQGVLNALAEVERTSRQLQATQDTLHYLDEAVAQAIIVRERSETRFTEGISSLDPVLDAEQALDPLQRQLATTRTNAWRQLSALVRSTGGSAGFRPFDSE